MDLSREGETCVRSETSEVEESAEEPDPCNCKSACSTQRKEGSTRGCPCRGANRVCTDACRCGKASKPCQNKDFINTLDSETIKKLCIRSLRRGIGSLDYIDPLLIMEDDLDNDNNEDDIAEAHSFAAEASITITPPPQPIPLQRQGPRPEWCVCGNCCNMPLEVEKVCCRKKKL